MTQGETSGLIEDSRRIKQRVKDGHRLWHAGNLKGAYLEWHEATMQRWAFCKKSGLDVLQTRVLSDRWVVNIGHFLYLDAYLKLFKLGYIDAKHISLPLDKNARIANPALLDLFRDHLTIRVSGGESYPELLRQLFFWLGEDLDYIRLDNTRCIRLPEATVLANAKWSEAGMPPLVHTTPEINGAGEAFLRRQGVNPEDWFISLHVRAPGYNFSQRSRRDGEIADYESAIKRMIAWGAKVIRLGDPTMPPAPAIPGLIDYAVMPDKDPKVDVYLASHCRFFLGCASGPGYLPPLFGVPNLLVNWAPMNCRPLCQDSYYLPKLYRDLSSGRILPMQEVMRRGLGSIEWEAQARERGIEIVDNTPDDLSEAVSYFYEHVVQGNALPEEDIRIQEAFASASTKAEIIGAGKVIPSFAHRYPSAWSEEQSCDAPTAFLHEPDWAGTDWRVVCSAYIEAFCPGEPVALVLILDPAREGQLTLEETQTRVLELVARPGREAFPDIVLVDHPEELPEALRPYAALQWVPFQRENGFAEGWAGIGATSQRLEQARARLVESVQAGGTK